MFFRKLNEWRKRPTEEQSYRFPFFITVTLLIGLTLWSVWDETFSRRPWKEFQNEFFRLELEKVTDEYNEEKKKFDFPENQKQYQDLESKLKFLKRGPLDPAQRKAYLEAKENLTQLKFKLEDLSRESQFTKSRFDAAYYLYEKAKLENSPDLDKQKEKVDRFQKKLDDLTSQIHQVEEESTPFWKIAQLHDDEVSKTEKAIAQMTSQLEVLEKRVSDVRHKSPKIEQIVISDLDRVDRCQTCHLAIDRPGFEDPQKYPQPFRTHPKVAELLKVHPLEKFACTVCHQGQGPALTVDAAHGEVHHWGFPLLRGQSVESSCRKCHTGTVETPLALLLSQGQILFSSLGCAGCHLAPGYEESWKVGPELTNVHQKTTLGWLERWILNPRSFKPTTRMPQFKVTEDEAKAMAHYLGSLDGTQAMTDEERSILSQGSPEEGKRLFTDLACIACHRIGEVGETFAPNLSFTGSKVRPEWLYRWLKNPRDHAPKGRMPNMRLADVENAHLVSYLMTLKKEGQPGQGLNLEDEEKVDPVLAQEGLKLMGSLGCHGCHVVSGLENRPRVGAELTSFGAKDLELLFFGYAKHIPHAWQDWTFNKIKDPQTFATERIEQKMPNFHLSDEETQALVTLLRSFRGDEKEIPLHYRKVLSRQEEEVEKGRNLVRHLNCIGCHTIENKGSQIAPNLNGEGEKVQPDWIFKFLKDPISIRPWLNVHMPRFNLSDEDAGHLVSYFSALSNAQYPYEFSYFGEIKVPQRERKAGEKLFEIFKCMSCHPVGFDPTSKGNQVVNLGPNLGLAKDRLRHDWIARWILEPEVLQPGTKMPTNFPKMGDKRISFLPNLLETPQFQPLKEYFAELFGPELDVFLNDAAWQTRAIRDFLISMTPEDIERLRASQAPPPQTQPETSGAPAAALSSEEEEW